MIKNSLCIVLRYPITIGNAIPLKASFFITYIMVDGWSGIAAEVLMLKPLIVYHLKNFFLVKTEKDREEAMDPGSIGFNTGEPRIQLYFLLGLVYAAVTPTVLPFIIIFFGLAYVVFRHQVMRCLNYVVHVRVKYDCRIWVPCLCCHIQDEDSYLPIADNQCL